MISDNLYEHLQKLPRRVLLDVMLEAMDHMQAYNGRTFTTCIMLAINAEEVEEGKWKLPSLKEIKRNASAPL